MTESDSDRDPTLAAAERVLTVLASNGIDAVVIGAMALAFHHYARATEDLDLAVATEPRALSRVADELRALGWEAEFRTPDSEDPLGGVLDARAPGAELVQVVNFSNPPAGGFPRIVEEALSRALSLGGGTSLKVVDLPTLVLFKLYAGGPKSKLDILELLERNPAVDLTRLREKAEAFGLLRELEAVLILVAEG